MQLNWKRIGGIVGIIAFLIILIFIALYFFGGNSSNTQTSQSSGNFGTPQSPSTVTAGVNIPSNQNLPIFTSTSSTATQQTPPVFKIVSGPIISGVLIQMQRPTT